MVDAPTPATLEGEVAVRLRIIQTLNEGRSVNPGDTHCGWWAPYDHLVRSTKAGASTPATPGLAMDSGRFVQALNEGRSVNPGDTNLTGVVDGPPRSLNEGRSVNPGDTAVSD